MRNNGYTLLGIESTRGTLASSLKNVPNSAPHVTTQQKYLRDAALRGQSGDIADTVMGVRNDMYEGKCYLYSDIMPILFRATLGGADVVGAAPSATTLAASTAVGATSITTHATVAAGSVIVIETPGTTLMESKLVTAVSGASDPFTLTLASPLLNAHASGVAVSGLTAHQISLLNNTAGSQPPSLSVQDFDGASAFQMLAGQLDELSIEYGAEKEMTATFKVLTNPFTSISAPSLTLGSEHLIPGWSQCPTIAGAAVNTVEEGSLVFKRSAKPVFAGGSQGPQAIVVGPLGLTGKEKWTVYSSDPMLTYGLTRDKLVLGREFTDPVTGHFIRIQMSQVQYDTPSRLAPGNIWTEVEGNFAAEMNATDAVSSGIAQVLVTVGNAQTVSY